MDAIERILSRPVAKPYRSGQFDASVKPHLNENGHLAFAPGDIENPKEWSTVRRWYCTLVCILLVLNAAFASSTPSGCLLGISEHFHVSGTAAGLVVTLFLLGYVAGPLFFAPLSEFYGRRWVLYGTFTSYLAFTFLCAFPPNFGALLVGRLLAGSFASALQTNVPGVLADIWGPTERGAAMAIFGMITFAGPSLGPVIGGFMQLTEDWRWSFYVLLWLAGASELLIFTVPETFPPTVLLNKARRLRATGVPEYQSIQTPIEAQGRTLGALFKVAILRPWRILFDPISLLIAIYLSVVYLLLYMLFSIYPIVFQEHRGWNAGVGQLPLIGSVIGAQFGGACIFYVTYLDKKKLEAGVAAQPEDRLPLAMIGGVGFVITMFWFAWTANFNSIHWIVPTIAGTLLSMCILLIFVGFLNYLTDTYLIYTASAMAANTICRSSVAAAAPLFTRQMFTALGVGGGGSLIGGVACLLAPIPFVFYKYGPAIRQRSKFAPTNGGSAPSDPNDEEKQDPSQVGELVVNTPPSPSSASSSSLSTKSVETPAGKEEDQVEKKQSEP